MAIDGETCEANEMCPAFSAVAQQEEKGAIQTALALYICDVCEYTVEGEAPNMCPVCGASKDKFSKFESDRAQSG